MLGLQLKLVGLHARPRGRLRAAHSALHTDLVSEFRRLKPGYPRGAEHRERLKFSVPSAWAWVNRALEIRFIWCLARKPTRLNGVTMGLTTPDGRVGRAQERAYSHVLVQLYSPIAVDV